MKIGCWHGGCITFKLEARVIWEVMFTVLIMVGAAVLLCDVKTNCCFRSHPCKFVLAVCVSESPSNSCLMTLLMFAFRCQSSIVQPHLCYQTACGIGEQQLLYHIPVATEACCFLLKLFPTAALAKSS